MKTLFTILIMVIILFANLSLAQKLSSQSGQIETIQSTIGKNDNKKRVTSKLDYTILVKNGESIIDEYQYITSSSYSYTYSTHFSEVPGFLKIQINKVYKEKYSGSFQWDYYTDLTLTADSNATPGRYTPKIIFDFYNAGSKEETDTIEINVTIYNQAPDKPQLTFPVNNGVNQHKNIILKWNELPTAKSYVVQLSTDQYFPSILKSDTVTVDTTTITGLNAEQKYYWRVKASNSAGSSAWSDTWSFTTGLEWEKTNAPINHPIKCFASNGSELFAGTDGGGVIHSTDNGKNWSVINNGLTDLKVQALYISNNNLFAGTYTNGIYLSTNNGLSWTLIKSMYYVNTFTKIGSYLIVGGDNYVYLSNDNGKNWTDITMNVTFSPIRLTSFATLGTTLYAGLNYSGIYLTSDLGKTWNKINDNYIECMATVDSKIFAGCNLMAGIIRSTDNGINWTPVNTGLNYPYSFKLIASGSNLFTLYSYDIQFSNNYGDNWTSIDLEFTNSYRRVLGINLNYLFVGTENDGIWRRKLIEMTGVNSPAKSQLISPGTSQNVLAGSVTFTWKKVKDAAFYLLHLSKDPSVTSIINSDSLTTDTTITITGLAGSQKYYWCVQAKNEAGNGEWSDIGNFTFTPVGIETITKAPDRFSLSQNYPNPFNPSTKIQFTLPIKTFVSLKIFDILGCEAATLVNEQKAEGFYNIEWNANGYPSGIYFYRLQAGSFNETKKLILLR